MLAGVTHLNTPIGPNGIISFLTFGWPLIVVATRLSTFAGVLGAATTQIALFFNPITSLDVALELIVLVAGTTLATRLTNIQASAGDYNFAIGLTREIARSRRHGSRLSALHAGYRSQGSIEKTSKLASILRDELHLYCEIFVENQDVLGLLPELDPNRIGVLKTRLLSATTSKGLTDIEIGIACFPDDAITTANLLEQAKLDRTRIPKVASIHDKHSSSPVESETNPTAR